VVVVGYTGAAPPLFSTPPTPGMALAAKRQFGPVGLARYTSPAPVSLPVRPYGRTQDVVLVQPP
jgi:hypothetical protein